MENENKQKNTYGKIEKEKLYFRQYVGDVEVEIQPGKKVVGEISVTAGQFSPIVRYGNNYFILTWKDIVSMACEHGLFEENENNG